MRSYERNGVTVDQCTECRGIFLDRGELERLVDAETSWNAAGAAPSAAPPPGGGADLGRVVGEVLQQARGGKHSGYGQPYGQRHPKRKKSFLEQLFD